MLADKIEAKQLNPRSAALVELLLHTTYENVAYKVW